MPRALRIGLLAMVTAVLAVGAIASFMGSVRVADDAEAKSAPSFLPAFRMGDTRNATSVATENAAGPESH